jgi:hypothetical protein
MTSEVRYFVIYGVTNSGNTFRPSDWAERLCGVMAQFRPENDTSDPRFTYSPFVKPTIVAGTKCVVVDERLRDIEQKAMDFVKNFAKDNNLPIVEACEIPIKSNS